MLYEYTFDPQMQIPQMTLYSCFERPWLLGNNRKLIFCLTVRVNKKIVYFEHLYKQLRSICISIDTYFGKYV